MLTLLFFNDVEEHEFPSNCTKSYLKLGERFFSESNLAMSFSSYVQFCSGGISQMQNELKLFGSVET